MVKGRTPYFLRYAYRRAISTAIQVIRAGRKTYGTPAGRQQMNEFDPVALGVERDRLLAEARTVLMAAPSDDAMPEMGVTPVVRMDGAFYIYPSRLSAHVRAVLAAGKAAFMVIEDESKAQNIWARKRLKFDSEIFEIDRKKDEFNAVCDVFSDSHGPTMALIRDFSDFHMLRLRPCGGVMVLGFAQAYRLSGEALDVTEHLRSG